jgi:uncharacterized protein
VRVGVVADSHVGEALPVFPPAALRLLEGVDVILHAGDLTDLSVLRELGRIAPVRAVQGDHDREGGIILPRTRVVRVGGYRIGITHGRRSRAVELPMVLLSLAGGRTNLLGFHRAMRRRFGPVDCIVHGHLHLPFCARIDGVLHFSPGAVYVPEADPGYERDHMRARLYLRFRRQLGPDAKRPSVGIIEAGPSGLRARVLPLDEAPPDPGDGHRQDQ